MDSREMISFAAAAMLACASAIATQPGTVIDTPITRAMVDVENSAVWVGGAETKEGYISSERVLWTRDDRIYSPYGEHYGPGGVEGPRHIRYAFTEPVEVGSILAVTGDRISVLKDDAPFPGDMADESQWVSPERLTADGKTTSDLNGGYVVWTFDKPVRTRALRVSHDAADPLEPEKRGWINSILLMPDRYQSLSMFARVYADINPNSAKKIVNQRHDGLGQTWSNVTGRKRREELPVVDKDHPGIVWLTWPEPVTIDALVALHTGFGAVEVDAFTGPAGRDPGTAREGDWTFVKAFGDMELNFPTTWPNIMRFDAPLTTRAIRLRMIDKMVCWHDHVKDQNWDGRRVYLDELLVLRRMAAAEPLAAPAFVARLNKPLNPPIPVKVTLPEDGNVTLVIEDAKGNRICNFVTDAPAKKGENTFWWDGTDDLGRDVDAANHGVLRIPPHPVEPGNYVVRGLWHKPITPVYEFGVYAPGRWVSGDGGSGWLANHCNPQAAAFVPAELSPLGEPLVYFGALVTEGPHGFMWVGMDGDKRGGLHWIGGNWIAAPYLAADVGKNPDPDSSVYVAGVFGRDGDDSISEVRINAIRKRNATEVRQVQRIEISRAFEGKIVEDRDVQLQGFAACDNRLALALNRKNAIWLVSGADGAILSQVEGVPAPRGLAFDPANGTLLAISSNRVIRVDFNALPATPGDFPVVVAKGLEDPCGLAVGSDGLIYVSDRGACHQVKVFNAEGRLIRKVGAKGVPSSGPYDEYRMNNPHGIAVDSSNRLWVTENDSVPKRISLWDDHGKLLRAWYGPGKYGEGGTLDSHDPTCFYYADGGGTQEYRINWGTGESKLINVLFRGGDYDFPSPGGYGDWGGMPEYATYHDGHRYLSNCYNNNPIAAPSNMSIFFDTGDGRLRPCVSVGRTWNWRGVVHKEEFASRFPDPNNRDNSCYIWCDRNNDGRAQPEEVDIVSVGCGCPILMPDMSITLSNFDGKAVRIRPEWKEGCDAPLYAFERCEVLATSVYGSMSDGGDYVLADDSDEVVMTKGAAPYSPYSFVGVKAGKAVWSYPTMWPGLHASHSAPTPNAPGQLIGTVRNLGPLMEPKGCKVGPVWFMEGNLGAIYIFTRDGMFVTDLFGDGRQRRRLASGLPAGVEQRGAKLEGMSLDGENFWPTSTCTEDGTVYMTACSRVIRVDGLDSLRPIKPFKLKVTERDLQRVQAYRVALEKQRHARQGATLLKTPLLPEGAIAIDGQFGDWDEIVHVDIEKQGVHAFFDSSSAPFDIQGAAAVCGGNLCLLWETGNRDFLRNSGENPVALFKTGGCLDFMIGTDPRAPADRDRPVNGDLRLLVTRVNDKTRALVYRQVDSTAKPSDRTDFSSPWRTFTFDSVRDVSEYVTLASDDGGRFELSIPLSTLGLKPRAGMRLKADIGVLRGDNFATIARHYWSNKSTSITQDVPSEAELTPGLWGLLEFVE